MRKLIVYLLLVLSPCILLIGTGEYLVRQVPNPYKYKEAWMQAHGKDVETIVLGGSHTFYGVKPDLLEGVSFNLANVSQGLEYDLYLLKRYDCPKLKTVIIPISFGTFFAKGLENGDEWYRGIFYKIYMDYPAHSDLSKYSFEFMNYRSFKGKIIKYFTRPSDVGYDEWGWGNTYKLENKNFGGWNSGKEAREAIQRHTYKDLSKAADNYSRLVEIIEYCNSRNIKLVLITTPCWHVYNEQLDSKQYSKMMELIHDAESQYRVTYLDYLWDSRFEQTDFYDSNHLTTTGAAKFTTILNEDLKHAKVFD